MNTPSCRLFVILARDAPRAVILRRGPSKWYHVIRWQTERDLFEHGAWFHGRIYEDRCDLSPDGNLFVYFCFGGASGEGYTSSWTAVSRAPWLYALALWPWGTTYGGGGRFLENRQLLLRVHMDVETHPNHPATGLEIFQGYPELQRPTEEIEGADWSGRDHKGRLIYCRGGKLYRRSERRKAVDREVADFNDLRPDPQPAPDWARRPLM